MIQEITEISLLKSTNWSRAQGIFDTIWSQISQGNFDLYRYEEPAYNATVYSLGNYGGVISSTSLTGGDPWLVWTGPLLEKCIPWALPLKEKLLRANLKFVNFAYSRHYTSIASHIDGKTSNEGKEGHCNINYLIKGTDTTARTWATDSGITQCYPGDPGRAWLLDTSVYHGVDNKGLREAFQIKFDSPYNHVADILSKNKDLLTHAY